MPEPDAPVENPEPPAEEPQPESPDEEDVPEPETPEETPPEAVFVEPYLGVDEFLAVAPHLRTMTPAMREAASAMLKRWLKEQGYDMHGYYPLAEWQAHYDMMLAAS